MTSSPILVKPTPVYATRILTGREDEVTLLNITLLEVKNLIQFKRYGDAMTLARETLQSLGPNTNAEIGQLRDMLLKLKYNAGLTEANSNLHQDPNQCYELTDALLREFRNDQALYSSNNQTSAQDDHSIGTLELQTITLGALNPLKECYYALSFLKYHTFYEYVQLQAQSGNVEEVIRLVNLSIRSLSDLTDEYSTENVNFQELLEEFQDLKLRTIETWDKNRPSNVNTITSYAITEEYYKTQFTLEKTRCEGLLHHCKAEEAIIIAERALGELRSINMESLRPFMDEFLLIKCEADLTKAESLMRKGEYDSAYRLANNALTAIQTNNNPKIKDFAFSIIQIIAEAQFQISEKCKLKGDFQRSFQCSNEAIVLIGNRINLRERPKFNDIFIRLLEINQLSGLQLARRAYHDKRFPVAHYYTVNALNGMKTLPEFQNSQTYQELIILERDILRKLNLAR
jgi:hypothetical protein